MFEMIDPAVAVALGLGIVAALLFALVVGLAGNSGTRRYRRRLAMVSGDKRAIAAASAPETRSLSRRDTTTPMIDRMVRRWMPRRDLLAQRLARTGRGITIGHYGVATIAVFIVALILGMFGLGLRFLPGLLIAAALGVGIPHMAVSSMGNRRVAAFLNLFPDAIDLMVRALRSGLPVSEAIVGAAEEIGDPVGAEFRTVESGLRMGRELDGLLWDIAKKIDAPEYRFFIIALSVQRETGGNLAETLANLSDLLRRRRSMRQKTRAMSSEARASTVILGSLPIVVTGILFFTSPSYITMLFTDARGMMLVGLAVGMLLTGIGIMVKMAKFEI
jgi:tight adherence protein B